MIFDASQSGGVVAHRSCSMFLATQVIAQAWSLRMGSRRCMACAEPPGAGSLSRPAGVPMSDVEIEVRLGLIIVIAASASCAQPRASGVRARGTCDVYSACGPGGFCPTQCPGGCLRTDARKSNVCLHA